MPTWMTLSTGGSRQTADALLQEAQSASDEVSHGYSRNRTGAQIEV